MNSQSQSSSSSAVPKKSGNNTTTMIIIVVVVAVLFLAVGGYFAWKYYFKAKFTAKGDTTTTTTTKNSAFTLSQLEEMIKYPNGTLTSTDRSKASGFTSVLEMETTDSVVAANNYYLSLNSNKKWTVSAKSLETDNSRADITYTGVSDQFTVTFVIDHAYDNTAILVRIDAADLPVGTGLGTTATTTTPTSTTTTKTPSTDTTKKTISTDYVIADSDSRVISESELTALSPWELKVARNEIYARHGRDFVHKDLQCYFGGKSWYAVDSSFTESVLSSTETKNIATIQSYELKISSPLASTDSGC